MPRLVSWNVLADAYVRREYFPSVSPALLAPGSRTAAIVARLVASDADLICLQEAAPSLVAAAKAGLGDGYATRFLSKAGGKPDGCAIFVRTRSLAIAAVRELVYADGTPPSGHVALLMEVVAGRQRIGVATTHLRWDPPRTPPASRWATAQIAALVAATVGDDSTMTRGMPWLVCGDFNIAADDPAFAILTAAGFADAYGGSPWSTATSVANGRARRIDFVLHTGGLRVRPLPIPRLDDATALPSEDEPSDHLMMGVTLDG